MTASSPTLGVASHLSAAVGIGGFSLGVKFYYNDDELCLGCLEDFFLGCRLLFSLKSPFKIFPYLVNFLVLVCTISLYVLDVSHLLSHVLNIFHPCLWIIVSLFLNGVF